LYSLFIEDTHGNRLKVCEIDTQSDVSDIVLDIEDARNLLNRFPIWYPSNVRVESEAQDVDVPF
jgi:hypothetical protein